MSHIINNAVEPFDIPQVADVHLKGIFGNFADVVQSQLDELEGKKAELARIRSEFLQFLLREVDVDRFTQIQRTYVTPEQVALGGDHLKYVDPIHWFKGKLNAALRIKLNEADPMEMLDIGTGCGHFPTIARFFGHNVLACDMPLTPGFAEQETHFYNAICEVYGVNKVDKKIEPFKEFDFGRRFDLVTAFMAAFNVMEDRTPYTIDAWKFFFQTLRKNVLTPDGYVYFQLTNGKLTDEVWDFLKSKAEWFEDTSKFLVIRDIDAVYS